MADQKPRDTHPMASVPQEPPPPPAPYRALAGTPPAGGRRGRGGGDRLRTLLKLLLIAFSLYLFMVGIGAMSASFKLMGSDFSERLLGTATGPLVSLFIGILATTLVQSSSTTTSVIVGLVAAGAIQLESAVFMVMGANVGTTVTNTLVSLGHLRHSAEYKRAFAAATVHDFFNVLVLLLLFPLELWTGWISWLAGACTRAFDGVGGTKLADPIKTTTKPVIDGMKGLFTDVQWGGVMMLILALALTFGMLFSMVKLLRSLMMGRVENLFDQVLFKTPFRGLLLGVGLTVLVQSSSITTSIAVPLVGAGLISLVQVFPYTMGANIGTTCTGLLAALAALAAAGADERTVAMTGVTLAFFHVLFNLLGVALVWPIRGLPIAIAWRFSELATRSRLLPVVYIVVTFYVLPFVIIWLGR